MGRLVPLHPSPSLLMLNLHRRWPIFKPARLPARLAVGERGSGNLCLRLHCTVPPVPVAPRPPVQTSVAGMIGVLESGVELQGTWHAWDGKVIPW